ncbi:hypothetical protein PsAD2_04391 [Pseudovibrio axinellae]|uniref:Uncharacterized protein n=1 Tax=Pseudovibrio axinellae TaxID=989403 RepID=A0A165T5L5_9HYPH|nr:hypothetical protein [Pseudovibrio axinellae]KZL05466.1 hypothetical protein PsAD2_04391 [Pseudovibrio axinellae]SEP98080.1 hypothetical protein SAMN05421798_101866 [Pseudovibrio axinellae]
MTEHSNNNMFSLMEVLSQNQAKAYQDYFQNGHAFLPFMQPQKTPAPQPSKTASETPKLPDMNFTDPANWQQMTGGSQQAMLTYLMTVLASDKNISLAVQRHFKRKDAMNIDSWMELMPVLLALLQGKMLMNYLVGPQKVMMEAFLKGFAKGCPDLGSETKNAEDQTRSAQEVFWSQMMPAENPVLDFWTKAFQSTMPSTHRKV